MSELNNFFDPLSSIIKTIVETKKHYNKLLAADFNVLSLIGTQEVLSTYFFRMLLDPNGPHGQGKIFLRLFLSELENSIEQIYGQEKIKLFLPELQKTDMEELIRIKNEFSTTEGQIDLFIEWKEFVLAIENKFWAVDQEEQLKRYAKYLGDYGKRFLLIYLCPTDKEPTEYSLTKEKRDTLEKSGNFLVLHHNDFTLSWLDKSIMHCEAEKVRWFLKDFKERINEIIKGDSKMSVELDQIKNFILSKEKEVREERIKIAVGCYSLIPNLYREVMEDTVKKLRDKLENFFVYSKGYKSITPPEFLKGLKWNNYVLYKENWIIDEKPILGFALAFDENDYGRLYICLLKGAKEGKEFFLDKDGFSTSQVKKIIDKIREIFKVIVGDPHEIKEDIIAYDYIQEWADFSVPWDKLYLTSIITFTDNDNKEKILNNIIVKFSKLSEEIENDIDELRKLYRETFGI